MANSFFRFKQFTIDQSGCAMKVGTDGVLIGAWSLLDQVHSVLDVGTGSGLIALMIAQRSPARIDAVEVEPKACEQAALNIARSLWGDRISLIHANFSDFVSSCNGYDLIVSNPPYFEHSLLSPDERRSVARHTTCFSFEMFFEKSLQMLRPNGRIALIYPTSQDRAICNLAHGLGLFPVRKTDVKGLPHLPAKRCLTEWSRIESGQPIYNTLIVETDRHQYSEEYIALTRDFYLKM